MEAGTGRGPNILPSRRPKRKAECLTVVGPAGRELQRAFGRPRRTKGPGREVTGNSGTARALWGPVLRGATAARGGSFRMRRSAT